MAKLTNNKNASKYYSSRQENYIASLLGGKVQPASGSTGFAKGDVILPNWLIECKCPMSEKKSFSIKLDWLDKNELERLEMHKPYSALVFQFEPDGENYFVLSEKTFKKMLDKFEQE